jgi:hypothetical protein
MKKTEFENWPWFPLVSTLSFVKIKSYSFLVLPQYEMWDEHRYWTHTSSLKLDDLPPDHVVKCFCEELFEPSSLKLQNLLPETSKHYS